MKFLILGDGYLGNKFRNYIKDSVLPPGQINSYIDVLDKIDVYHPHVLINCIGKTGRPNIDWCETHKEETLFSNLSVPLMIQHACKLAKVRMVHISTGCMYDGEGFTEEDPPNFIKSYYSKTKYLAEQALSDFDVLQVRIRMPIDGAADGRNLLVKLLNYEKIINMLNSISIIPDVLIGVKELIQLKVTGIFNMVNPQPVTHNEILEIYNQYSDEKKIINNVTLENFNSMVIAGRSNCVLSTKKLNDFGIKLENTKESLHNCIRKFVNEKLTASI